LPRADVNIPATVSAAAKQPTTAIEIVDFRLSGAIMRILPSAS
jgi:hypothetical protein